MGYGYIKTNINAMKFECIKDKDKIIFNHYIMRKENLNRIQNKLPIGQFNMTISSVSNDLNISRSKAQRLINEFLDKNIIKLVAKGSLKSKDASIYEYITSDTEENTVNETKNISDINDFIDSNDTKIDTTSDKSKKVSENFVFHGSKYHGVESLSSNRRIDTISFVKTIGETVVSYS